MIENYLNKKNSIRNLSDIEFNNIVKQLAFELESIDYIPSYTAAELHTSFIDLCKWNATTQEMNSTSRLGLKLCEHFFPNFYEIEMNGKSFKNLWNANNLEKILHWNRKSHSTPYLSEIKRGIYFCCGLTKNTMYRPQMAKMICDYYKPEIVLDPCAGWGGRMLGVVASGSRYIAFEPNTKTYDNLNRLASFLNIQDRVNIICDDALSMNKYNISNVDLVLTSPPYFDLEIYTNESTQSIANHKTYQSWDDNFMKPLIKLCLDRLNINGKSCWNVGKVGKHDMNNDVLNHHTNFNFVKETEFTVMSSKRQAINKTKKDKSSDNTVVYTRGKK